MLTQLSQLSIKTDGRFASDKELRFLEDYFDSLEKRISTYKKVRDSAEEIIEKMRVEKIATDPTLFRLSGKDVTERCQHDLHRGLRYAVITVLFNDMDYLRENPLLWYRSIVHSFGFAREMVVTYQIFPEVVEDYLDEEELELLLPVFKLYQSILQ